MALRVLRIAGSCCLATAVVYAPVIQAIGNWTPNDVIGIALLVFSPLLGGFVLGMCLRTRPTRGDGAMVGILWWLVAAVSVARLEDGFSFGLFFAGAFTLIPLAALIAVAGLFGGIVAERLSARLIFAPTPNWDGLRPWHVGGAAGLGYFAIVMALRLLPTSG